MKKVMNGNQVRVNIVGQTEDKVVFTPSGGERPLTLVVGSYKKIRGLNSAIVGMGVGERRKVIVSPEDGFGAYNRQLLLECQLDDLPKDIKRGDVFLDSEKNKWFVREVTAENGTACIDGNHILAGKRLIFDIELLEIIS